jgi:trehalose 6-phosphate phosphatase
MNPALQTSPPPLPMTGVALFLDLDGTLARIEPRPGDVGPEPERTRILQAVVQRLEGRVAVLTGRAMGDADRILEQTIAAVAAVHGLERRLPDGATVSFLPSQKLPHARMVLEPFVESRKGLLLEDKGTSLAVHYRGAPDAEPMVHQLSSQLAVSLGLTLQRGSMVYELRTPGPNKGDALKGFLSQAPFLGCRPVMVGDDLTDEDAFAAAEEAGGYGVLVGPSRPTRARYRLESVGDVLTWLDAGARA